MYNAFEIASLIKKGQESSVPVISDDNEWKVNRTIRKKIAIKKKFNNTHIEIASIDDETNSIRILPGYKRYEECMINAAWLASGEILFSKEQYIQGYATLLSAVMIIEDKIKIDFKTSSLVVEETNKDNEVIVHTFAIQQGDKYMMADKEVKFQYLIKFVHAVFNQNRQNYKLFHKTVIAPLSINDIIKKINISSIYVTLSGKKKRDLTENYLKGTFTDTINYLI